MQTDCLMVDPEHPDPHAIERAALAIRSGDLVAFPTETVYGLGANALDADAVRGIFAAKGRPADNPLIVHLASAAELPVVACDVSAVAQDLAARFWPGPLTMLFARTAAVPDATTAGLDTVAVRVPRHPTARALIRAAGVPVAAPSANRSGRPSPTSAHHVLADLDGSVRYVLDGGPCSVGVESTVVDVRTGHAELLRPGGLPIEALEAAGIRVRRARPGDRPLAPGMKYRHYAPSAPVHLLSEPTPAHAATLARRPEARHEALVASSELPAALGIDWPGPVICYGSRQRLAEVAAALFDALRRADAADVRAIWVEPVPETGLGLAIMDRLRKAASSAGEALP